MGTLKKRFFFTLILVSFLFLSVLISLVLGEKIVKKFKPQATYSDLIKRAGSYYAPSEFNKVTLKKNYSGQSPSMETPGTLVPVNINSVGLRGPDVTYERKKDFKRILIMGDSYTFGVYVADDEVYPRVLEKKLSESKIAVEVLNSGYSNGFEADEQYNWLVNEGIKFKPDLVIYGFFIGNDLGLTPNLWQKTDADGLPIKIHDPNMKVDDMGIIRSFEADGNRQVGYEWYYRNKLLRDSHLGILLGSAIDDLYQKYNNFFKKPEPISDKPVDPPGYSMTWYPYIFGDTIAPLYKHYGLTEDSIKRFDKMDPIFRKLVTGMKKQANQIGAEFMMVLIPFNFQVEPEYFIKLVFQKPVEAELIKNGKVKIVRNYFEEIKPFLDQNNIPYIDILKEMQTAGGKYYPRNAEVHFNPNGHAFTAERLSKFILEKNLLK